MSLGDFLFRGSIMYAKVKRGSGLNYLLINDRRILVINMARKPRIHYPGPLYHIMVRGNKLRRCVK